jgi:hypothetical protein
MVGIRSKPACATDCVSRSTYGSITRYSKLGFRLLYLLARRTPQVYTSVRVDAGVQCTNVTPSILHAPIIHTAATDRVNMMRIDLRCPSFTERGRAGGGGGDYNSKLILRSSATLELGSNVAGTCANVTGLKLHTSRPLRSRLGLRSYNLSCGHGMHFEAARVAFPATLVPAARIGINALGSRTASHGCDTDISAADPPALPLPNVLVEHLPAFVQT